MSQPAVRNKPVIVCQKDVSTVLPPENRSTGSPLLDSLVFTQKISSRAYLPQPITTGPAPQSVSRVQPKLALQSLPAVERLAASQQARPSAPADPAQVLSVPGGSALDSSKTESCSQSLDKPLDQPSASQSSDALDVAEQSIKPVVPNLQARTASRERPASIPLIKAKDVSDRRPAFTRPVPTHLPSFTAPTLQRSGKRLPNPSLERAAAVGMLDLSDKLLFGGEDDALTSTYLGDEDPLTAGDEETIVLKYLSKQIAESNLAKIKGRLPLAVRSQPETEPSKAVLDARSFKVVQAALKSKDVKVTVERQQPQSAADVAAMGQQIANLSQQVETLTKALSKLSSQDSLSESSEVA